MRCLRGGVVDGCGGKEAKVVVVWLWLFGNDVGGGDLVVVGVVLGTKVKRCLRCGVVDVKRRRWWWLGCGCLGTMLVVAIWLLGDGWSKITIEKEKRLSQRVAAR